MSHYDPEEGHEPVRWLDKPRGFTWQGIVAIVIGVAVIAWIVWRHG